MAQVIKCGKLVTMAGPIIEDGLILVDGTGIVAAGKDLEIPGDAEVIDASDQWVTPGLIDVHTHISTFPEPQVLGGRSDGNEMTAPVQAHLRGLDALNPFDPAIPAVRSAGFTTCYTGPGSGNVICGTGLAFKLRGRTVDEMVIPGTEQMKMALGENPKTAYGERKETPMTRMGTAAVLRETLAKALDYARQLEKAEAGEGEAPAFDFRLEALVPVVRGQMKARIHCHRSDDIVTAVRVAKEYGLDFALEHATEGYLIADFLARHEVTCVVGPLLLAPYKMELWNLRADNPARLVEAGVTVCLTEDAGSQTKYLPMHIGYCMAEGLSEEAAFEGVTVNPARLLGLFDRIGSIEPGKSADLAFFDGYPFSNRTRCTMTMIEGARFPAGE